MTDRRRRGLVTSVRLAAMLVALLGAGVPAGAAPVGVAAFGESHVVRVVDRLEMHSYQPYSGLQFGFRPEPPAQHGVTSERPTIVMPKRLAPLIEYGTPSPYSAQWYAYCAEKFQSFEPRSGRYTTYSGESRLCR